MTAQPVTPGTRARAGGATLLASSLLALPLVLLAVMSLGGFTFGTRGDALGAGLVLAVHLGVTVLLPLAYLRGGTTAGARRAWWLTVPAMAYAVIAVVLGAGMAFDGWEASRSDCRQIFCDLGLYIGPVVAGYFMIVAAAVAYEAKLLRAAR